MRKIFAAFPGQGSQFVGMGKAIVSDFPAANLVFEEVSDVLGFDVKKLCFEGPKEDLSLTANTQPAILAVSVAVYRTLLNESGFSPAVFAGHSLGEYSALVAAGGLSLASAAMLVRRRGEAMQSAVPVGVGAMAACMKMAASKVEEICREVTELDAGSTLVQIANYNSASQVVVAGHAKGVDEFCKRASEQGGRAIKLDVSAPFHTCLMKPARDVMEPLLREQGVSDLSGGFIPNLTGNFVERYEVDNIISQIDNPVHWTRTMETALEVGIDLMIEVGPGSVLSGLARRSLPHDANVLLIQTKDLGQAIASLN